MACTRLKNDRDVILWGQQKDLTGFEYMLNVPGNGTEPYYIEDPHIRLQKFGANISSNIIDVNTNLMGLNRHIGRDCTQSEYKNYCYSKNIYKNNLEMITDESRTTYPAWQLRDLEQNNWNYLHKNPQNHTEITFANNLSSRIIEKDNYKREFPCIN